MTSSSRPRGRAFDGTRDAVGAEHGHGAARDRVDVIDEDRALALEIAHDVPVVHDLVEHVHRRAVDRERAFDDLDRARHPRTEPPGPCEQDIHQASAPGRAPDRHGGAAVAAACGSRRASPDRQRRRRRRLMRVSSGLLGQHAHAVQRLRLALVAGRAVDLRARRRSGPAGSAGNTSVQRHHVGRCSGPATMRMRMPGRTRCGGSAAHSLNERVLWQCVQLTPERLRHVHHQRRRSARSLDVRRVARRQRRRAHDRDRMLALQQVRRERVVRQRRQADASWTAMFCPAGCRPCSPGGARPRLPNHMYSGTGLPRWHV